MQMTYEEYYEAIEYFQDQYSGLNDYSYLRSHQPELIECYHDGRSIAEFDELAHFNDLISMRFIILLTKKYLSNLLVIYLIFSLPMMKLYRK